MPKFEVVSKYEPAGDQPKAIDALAAGVEMGLDEQTLLGVTVPVRPIPSRNSLSGYSSDLGTCT